MRGRGIICGTFRERPKPLEAAFDLKLTRSSMCFQPRVAADQDKRPSLSRLTEVSFDSLPIQLRKPPHDFRNTLALARSG